MTINMGSTDRMIRGIAGIALIALGLTGVIGWWGIIGVVLLATAVIRVCPAYLPFGLSTLRKK
jgi:phosphate/sulfate permease